MTEELEKEAEEKWWNENAVSGASLPNKIYVAGYLAGAEPREKRIEELEAQIKKMKLELKQKERIINTQHRVLQIEGKEIKEK